MTDTKAPTVGWGTIVMGLMPSLNTSIVAIVTAVLSIGGTLWAQRPTVSAPPPSPIAVKIIPVDPVSPRLTALEKKFEDQAAEMTMLRAEIKVQEKRKRNSVSVPPKQ